jgi:hypothetical protein
MDAMYGKVCAAMNLGMPAISGKSTVWEKLLPGIVWFDTNDYACAGDVTVVERDVPEPV